MTWELLLQWHLDGEREGVDVLAAAFIRPHSTRLKCRSGKAVVTDGESGSEFAESTGRLEFQPKV